MHKGQRRPRKHLQKRACNGVNTIKPTPVKAKMFLKDWSEEEKITRLACNLFNVLWKPSNGASAGYKMAAFSDLIELILNFHFYCQVKSARKYQIQYCWGTKRDSLEKLQDLRMLYCCPMPLFIEGWQWISLLLYLYLSLSLLLSIHLSGHVSSTLWSNVQGANPNSRI